MQSQRLDQMNDLWQDRLLDAYERQQERNYEEMVNEEPPFDEELEMQARVEANPAHYQFIPFDFRGRIYGQHQ